MIVNQEYFTVELASKITLGLSLNEMVTVAQFETKNICIVPGVADFWYGVVNFKGSLLWILDSDRFFNGANAPASLKETLPPKEAVSLMGETPQSRRLRSSSPTTGDATASRTALHRFFNLPHKHQQLAQKLTVVVVKNRLSSSNKQVAIAVRQLKGIAAVSPSNFKPLSNKISPRLRQCCSTAAQVEEQFINIIDSEALLQQLSKESMLIST